MKTFKTLNVVSLAVMSRRFAVVEDTANSVEDTRLKQHLIQTRPDLMSHLTGARDLQRQVVAQY